MYLYCTGSGKGLGWMGSNILCRNVHTDPRQNRNQDPLFRASPVPFTIPVPCSVNKRFLLLSLGDPSHVSSLVFVFVLLGSTPAISASLSPASRAARRASIFRFRACTFMCVWTITIVGLVTLSESEHENLLWCMDALGKVEFGDFAWFISLCKELLSRFFEVLAASLWT